MNIKRNKLLSKSLGKNHQKNRKKIQNKRFEDYLTAVKMKRTSIKCNKPIFIGATVLEISKLLMYDFYYNVLQPHFGEKHIEILYFDSVTADTPILIKHNNKIFIRRISEILDNQNKLYVEYGEKEIIQITGLMEVWTANGWNKLNNIIRHKTNKKIVPRHCRPLAVF